MAEGSEDDPPSFGRALFTPREREILGREATVKDNYRYKVESVARRRVALLEKDIEVLREHYPELLAEIEDAVCDES